MIHRLRHASSYGLLGALTLIAAHSAPVAPPERSEFLVEVWDTDRGLPSSAVTSIAATPDGYLWVATFEGLARFDGSRFTVFNRRTAPGFPDDAVVSLFSDPSGRLWAGTLGGIARYEHGKWIACPKSDGTPLRNAVRIMADDNGVILATAANHLYRFNGKDFSLLPDPPRIAYLRVYNIPGQGIWGSAQDFFGRFRDGRWQEVALPPGMTSAALLGTVPGQAQSIWAISPDSVRKSQNGLWLPPRAVPRNFRFATPIHAIEDSAGNLWAGDFYNGLLLFRPDGTIQQMGRDQGLPNAAIRSLFEGPDHSIWIATDGGGLVRFRPRLVVMFDESQQLRHSVVDSVSEQVPGHLLVTTYGGGLTSFDEAAGIFRPFVTRPGGAIPDNSLVLSVLTARDGTVWLAQYGKGVFRISGAKIEQLPETSAPHWNAQALLEDSRRTLWIGHRDGVASYAAGVFQDHANDPGAPHSEITALAEDSHGDLWAGGIEGLYHLHNGAFEKYVPPGLAAYANITALYADKSGSLWIGSLERGLDRLRDGAFTAYGVSGGLMATRVSSIVEDDDGRMWLATARQGLVGVTRASLDAAPGNQAQLDLIWLTRDEGLATNQMRSGFQPAACKSADGRLWFATLKGLAMLDPRGVSHRDWISPVRIVDVVAGGRRVLAEEIDGNTITVPPGNRHLQIRFTEPVFSNSELVRFQYRLDGVNPNWIDAPSQSANYGDLRPGRYTFRVRATNQHGAWGAQEATLQLVLLPAYWETIWFRLAMLLALVILTGAAVYASQMRRLRRKTEQLEREQALRRDVERMQTVLKTSEERFSKAFDASPLPMSINSLDDGVFLDVNQRFLERTGLRRHEVVGRRRSEIGLWIDPGDADRFTEAVRANGRVRNFEARLRSADGPPGYHLLFAEVIQLDGRPCVLVTSEEITERKQLQEQLHQAQKLESIGRLAGGVAHDFNNLLTVINGYSDLILQRMDPFDRNRVRVEQIRTAGDRAAALTGQLLAFSRKQVIKLEPLDLNALIHETEPLLRRLLPESIEVSLHLTPGMVQTMADPTQLQQVLMNLAINARDAMPDGGRLMIETDAVELDKDYSSTHAGVSPGPYVMLSISDTGVGMTEDVRQHVFEPFFTTKKKGAGTGLGLATVYGIVRQCGGWIWVYSEPGNGATFKIYFPRIPEQVRQQAEEPQGGSFEGSETILVVEDQEAVRKLAKEVLQEYGYRVLDASDGAEALQLALTFEDPIDLLLTDVVMPGITGKELAVRMSVLRPGIKVLYMSGYTENVIARQGVLDAGIAFIAKPLMPEALAAKVRETLGSGEES